MANGVDPYRTRKRSDSYSYGSPVAPPKGLAALGAKRGRIAAIVVAIGVLTFSAGWVPSGKTVHTFTTASDYNPVRESGCTNSGDGCHGSETEYVNFNSYHPDTECTACHDYQGVGCIPCHGPKEHECAACHDGTMDTASDCVRLSDPFPKGHYRETTHTAMGTVMTREVRNAEDGKAKLACSDCHSRDLKTAHAGVPEVEGSTYGVDVGCGECHNDTRSNGLAQVTSNWEKHRCEDCHTEDSSTPMHAASIAPSVEGTPSVGCGSSGAGCHASDDLHGLHPTAPENCSGSAADGEAGCHDLEIESHAPTATTCGAGRECHSTDDAYDADLEQHNGTGGIDGEHHRAGYAQASDTYTDSETRISTACSRCHSMVLGIDHTRPNASFAPGDACVRCHNASDATVKTVKASWSQKDTQYACAACHGKTDVPAPHGAIESAHVATQYDRYGKAADDGCLRPGCHATADVRTLHKSKGCTFAGCHTNTDDIRGSNIMSCGGTDGQPNCHTASERHSDADQKHLATEIGRTGEPEVGACQKAGCHVTTDVRALHATLSCETPGCHVEDGPTNMSCGGTDDTTGACHTAKARHSLADGKHLATEYSRYGEPEVGSCAKAGCHETTDVRDLHETTHCYGAGCHAAGGPTYMSCGGPDGTENVCHTSSQRHFESDEIHLATEYSRYGEPEVGSCAKAGCHETTDVRDLHETTRCYNTAGCHMAGGPEIISCGGPDDTEGVCHTSSERHFHSDEKHTGVELGTDGTPQVGACTSAGCHETTNLRDLHVTGRCYNTAGCHMEGGPGVITCGGIESDISCHNPPPSTTCTVPPAPSVIEDAPRGFGGSAQPSEETSSHPSPSVPTQSTVDPVLPADAEPEADTGPAAECVRPATESDEATPVAGTNERKSQACLACHTTK